VYVTTEKPKISRTDSSDLILILKAEIHKLSEDIQNTRRSHSKQINGLTAELDELKKLRLSMQVEVERMKKLMA
jgi:DNA anti-recombination protein RmuC